MRFRFTILTAVAVLSALVVPSAAFARGYFPIAPWPQVTGTLGEPVAMTVAPDGERFVVDRSGSRVVVLSSAGEFLRAFDGSEVFGEALVTPVSVEISPLDATVHVVDEAMGRVSVFTRSGAWLRSYGTAKTFSGTGKPALSIPSDIAFDGSGNSYVGELAGNRVVVFTPAGAYSKTIDRPDTGSTSDGPWVDPIRGVAALAVSSWGEVYIAESNDPHRVLVYNANTGVRVTKFGYLTNFDLTSTRWLVHRDIALAPQGLILSTFMYQDQFSPNPLVSWALEIIQVGAGVDTGLRQYMSPTPLYETGSLQYGMAVRNGRLFLTDANASNARFVEFEITEGFPRVSVTKLAPSTAASVTTSPLDIATAPDGSYYVADAGSATVKRFSAAGAFLASFPASGTVPGFAPRGVAVSASGTEVYVSDVAANTVRVFSASSGSLLRSIGASGTDPGSLSTPRGLALRADGAIAVADSGNNRVQVLDPVTGEALAVVSSALSTSSPLLRPEGVSFDPATGEILVADTGNQRVLRFAPSSDPLAPLTERYVLGLALPMLDAVAGGDPGQLSSPVDVIADAGGALLVVERANSRIQWFSATGTETACSGIPGRSTGQIRSPQGIVRLADGDVLVADTANGRVVRWRWDDSAPVTTISGGLWTPSRGPSVVSLSATDTGSGVAKIRYRIDEGPDTLYSSPITFTAEGEYQVWYWSEDRLGNIEVRRNAPVRIDRTAPTATVTLAGMVGRSVPASTAILSTVFDTPAAFNSTIQMTYDVGAGAVPWGPLRETVPFSLSTEGTHTIRVGYRDSSGNITTRTIVAVRDTVPPVTTIFGGPASGVAPTATTLSLRAVDANDPVPTVQYSLDGTGFVDYADPFVVSGEGSHTVSYRGRDEVGNLETLREYTFAIDSRVPTGTLELDNPVIARRSRVITLVPSMVPADRMRFDTGSGFGAWVPYSALTTVAVSADGTRSITGEFMSKAGLSTTATITLFIDSQAPSLFERPTVLRRFFQTPTGFRQFDLGLSVLSADRGSPAVGILRYSWRVGLRRMDSMAPTSSIEMTSVAPGTYSYSVSVVDRFGNTIVKNASMSVARLMETMVPLLGMSGSPLSVFAGVDGVPTGTRAVVECYRRGSGGVWVLSRSYPALIRAENGRLVSRATPMVSRGEWRFVTVTYGSGGPVIGIPSDIVVVR